MKRDIMNEILTFVEKREDIRAAILLGSRANSNAPTDEFQDYDFLLIVNHPDDFLNDQSWINQFGHILIKQVNPSAGEKLFYGKASQALSFLMLFKEGFRIDMGFSTPNDYERFLDSLSTVIIDKDHIIPSLPKASDESFWVKKPVEAEFDYVINEFFWCLPYVAKGIYRDELPYVKGMYEMVIRRVYMRMISWYIGLKHDWKVNVGKLGKWFKRYLPKDLYALYEKSYSGKDYEEIWDSLFDAGKLFRLLGVEIATQLHYQYPIEDDENVMAYLKEVREKNQKK